MTTSNGEGSGWLFPGTGVMANNMMGEDDLHPGGFHAAPPGERVASMMAPSVVVGADGTVALAVGSGGSKRIRTAIVQVVSAAIDQGRPLADAVDGPAAPLGRGAAARRARMVAAALAALAQRWPGRVAAARSLLRRGPRGGARPGGRRRPAPRRLGPRRDSGARGRHDVSRCGLC